MQIFQEMSMPEDVLSARAIFLENVGTRPAPSPDIELRIGKVFRPYLRNRLPGDQ